MGIDARELRPGSVVAGYRIERLLGAGGMGSVYLAAHPSLPRLVALKLPDPSLTRTREGRDRVLREADHAARLDHPNIVAVLDRGSVPHRGGDRLWIAMQYVDGTDAATPLRRGPMTADRAIAIAADIARALDHAHRAGVLHRDVKPANILLTAPRPGERERALLADFGIAKGLDSPALTRTGTVVASLQYAAPEQLEGRPLDGRSDQYALGCTLYHLLTGRAPFPGSDTAHLVHAHLNLPAPRVTAARPELPPALDAVIARAMAKNPADRFPSSDALAAAARSALGAGTPAPPPSPQAPPAPTRHLAAPTPTGPAAVPAPARGRRLLVPLAACAVLAALAAAGVAWLPDAGRSDAAPPPAHTPAPPPTTTPPPPTTSSPPTNAPPAPVSVVDEQGFGFGGPRCDRTDPAVTVARTAESAIVVCRTASGRLYSKARRSDDTPLDFANPKATEDGYTAGRGVRKYALDEDALTITVRGDVIAREPVLEYHDSDG
ncbi:serine/threonine-protein kinase [Rhodococcus sp. NPDC058505]|uniref:serine/threonine-protein kinase n=1 Tax=unclassified Rhodococcus (in: high G+C Gram-positive bacteria) TaxID=192944 RepID=UPI003660B4D5